MQEFEKEKYLWNRFQIINLHQYTTADTAWINQKDSNTAIKILMLHVLKSSIM